MDDHAHRHSGHAGHAHQHAGMEDNASKDPVCGMDVSAAPSKSISYKGKAYYFCSARCMEKFRSSPDDYAHLNPQPVRDTEITASAEAIYTCPMHPQIRQVGPGNCPICGMALEPMEAASAADTGELLSMTRRFQICLVLTLPLLAISMGDFFPG